MPGNSVRAKRTVYNAVVRANEPDTRGYNASHTLARVVCSYCAAVYTASLSAV